MRFSEHRIDQLSRAMARELIANNAVGGPKATLDNVASLIASAITRNMELEESIEEEARERIARMPHSPPPGSGEYDAIFSRQKAEIAAKRGFPL